MFITVKYRSQTKEKKCKKNEFSNIDSKLHKSISGWPSYQSKNTTHVIGVLPGEGIGPEIIEVTLNILDTIAQFSEHKFKILTGGDIGCPAQDKHGAALTSEVKQFCNKIFNANGALLCGAGGARFVYDLRTEFDLFCKFLINA